MLTSSAYAGPALAGDDIANQEMLSTVTVDSIRWRTCPRERTPEQPQALDVSVRSRQEALGCTSRALAAAIVAGVSTAVLCQAGSRCSSTLPA